MAPFEEEAMDYELISSCGQSFPSHKEFLHRDSRPPRSLQPSLLSYQEGRDYPLMCVKDGSHEEGGCLVIIPSKSPLLDMSRAQNITYGSKGSKNILPSSP
jgi:hypothetical protein